MNYIKNIMDDSLPQSSFITWQVIANAQFAFTEPFLLRLSDKTILQANEILRLIPNSRMTVAGIWQGKPVVAKLFFGRDPNSQLEQEVRGIQLLETNKIPTPSIYQQTTCQEQRLHVLINEYIKTSINLQDCWNAKNQYDGNAPYLTRHDD